MARIAGIDLPLQKRVEIGLTYIYGIGSFRAKQLLDATKVPFGKKVKDLSEDEVLLLQRKIQEGGLVEGELRKQVRGDIGRLVEIGSYRGIRHRKGLPVRGQRTNTNARTRKGPRSSARTVPKTKKAE
jgi:small subunit ribosomal protein S13